AGAVKRCEQPVARAVAREDAPGGVAAGGRRREADHIYARMGVAEARERPAPIDLACERRALLASDALSPLDEARALAAVDYPLLEFLECAQAFSLRPVAKSQCDQRNAGIAS